MEAELQIGKDGAFASELSLESRLGTTAGLGFQKGQHRVGWLISPECGGFKCCFAAILWGRGVFKGPSCIEVASAFRPERDREWLPLSALSRLGCSPGS